MDIYTQVKNLENLVNSLLTTINNNQKYVNADIEGVSQRVTNITPFSMSKTAYIEDSKVVFDGVPEGNVTVTLGDPSIHYETIRDDGRVTVVFDPLKEVMDVTISII